MKKVRLKKIKQIIKTTKIITAMQIRRIKIQKLPVSWNLQDDMTQDKEDTKR